jgi:hypothetical protein
MCTIYDKLYEFWFVFPDNTTSKRGIPKMEIAGKLVILNKLLVHFQICMEIMLQEMVIGILH